MQTPINIQYISNNVCRFYFGQRNNGLYNYHVFSMQCPDTTCNAITRHDRIWGSLLITSCIWALHFLLHLLHLPAWDINLDSFCYIVNDFVVIYLHVGKLNFTYIVKTCSYSTVGIIPIFKDANWTKLKIPRQELL